MRTGKLNARKVATVKPGKYGDGGGLWLYVGPNSRSWVYRYMIVGKAREMGLGSFGNLTLEEARELARQHRRGVHQKPESGGPVDPLHERQAAEIRGIRVLTFRRRPTIIWPPTGLRGKAQSTVSNGKIHWRPTYIRSLVTCQ